MNTNTFTIHYYLRTDKKPKDSKYPIYCRITVNGQRGEITLKRYIEKVRWDHKAQRVKGASLDAREINSRIIETTTKLNSIETKLSANDEPVTKDAILNKYHGRDVKHKTLIEAFEYHNSMIRERVGEEYAPATYKRYETTKDHVISFLKATYHKEDLPLRQLTYEFITSLEHYFKTIRKCNHNTSMKYIKNFKKIIQMALNNGWLDKDPFRMFKTPIKEVKREFLSKEELDIIQTNEIHSQRLDLVRDLFVFACYTGLAYIDIKQLTRDNIEIGIDGKPWIFRDRKKTGVNSKIPILSPARSIIDKYEDFPKNNNEYTLLPVLSNQKLNAYLKEIADICGIKKNLTFHLARHTFATTVTLTNGVSIETVSNMLGHKNIRTTQIYSKVVEQKISSEMEQLERSFNDNGKILKQGVK